ncbi:putative signal transduction protein containing EFhand domain (plasmid) [Nostoc sp. HK-01]|nr:putative signal transduction protein containing EFhand domain [Nostoc sp. HK-01]
MTTEQELRSLFNTLDGAQDGKISLNELFLSPGLSAVISSQTNTTRVCFKTKTIAKE